MIKFEKVVRRCAHGQAACASLLVFASCHANDPEQLDPAPCGHVKKALTSLVLWSLAP